MRFPIVLLVVAISPGLGGQPRPSPSGQVQVLEVDDALACATCEIKVTKLVTLGATEGPGFVESELTLGTRDGRGLYYLFGVGDDHVNVFNHNGLFLRTLGRAGQGPAEFQSVRAVRFADDGAIFVYDSGNSRVTRFSSSFELQESILLDIRPNPNTILLPNQQTVIASMIRSPSMIGYPLHLVGANGSLLTSFGSESGFFAPGISERWLVASSWPGHVWTAAAREYSVERWSLRGELMRRVRRRAPWFDRTAQVNPLTQPPEPIVSAIQEDRAGRLWVLLLVPDPRWRDQIAPAPTDAGIEFVGTQEDYLDTVIEVLDVEEGKVIARKRLPEQILAFVDEGIVGAVKNEPLDLAFHIFGLELLGNWKGGAERSSADRF